MRKIPFIFLILFFEISIISSIAVYPKQINFEVEPGELSCRNVTILSSGNILFQDRWAKKNIISRDIGDYKVNKESLKISLEYPPEKFIYERGSTEICFSGNVPGNYNGVLLIRERNSLEGIGVWINASVFGEEKEKGFSPITGFSILNKEKFFAPNSLLTFSGIFLFLLLFGLIVLLKRK